MLEIIENPNYEFHPLEEPYQPRDAEELAAICQQVKDVLAERFGWPDTTGLDAAPRCFYCVPDEGNKKKPWDIAGMTGEESDEQLLDLLRQGIVFAYLPFDPEVPEDDISTPYQFRLSGEGKLEINTINLDKKVVHIPAVPTPSGWIRLWGKLGFYREEYDPWERDQGARLLYKEAARRVTEESRRVLYVQEQRRARGLKVDEDEPLVRVPKTNEEPAEQPQEGNTETENETEA